MAVPKLTTAVACRTVGLNRDRFNEYVAAGQYRCAPSTIPGRARLFNPDDMLTLFLFKRFIDDDGLTVERAGLMACAIGAVAKEHPEARAITWVESYFRNSGHAYLTEQVPPPEDWDTTLLSGMDIRSATTIRIGKERDLVAHYTEEETAIVGDPEEDFPRAEAIAGAADRYQQGLITRDEFLLIVSRGGE